MNQRRKFWLLLALLILSLAWALLLNARPDRILLGN